MTETKTRTRRPQRTKLRAVTQLFYNNRIVEADEVFLYEGDELPPKDIAVRASEDAQPGTPPVVPEPLTKEAPDWTTKGFVDKANRTQGREDADSDLLT